MTPSAEQEPTMISSLPQVTTPEVFFSIDKMIIPVAIPLVGAAPQMIEEALRYGGILYQDTAYLISAIFGSPESLFNNIANGVFIEVGRISFTYRFHKDLELLLDSGLVFDASGYDSPAGLTDTYDFYITRCIGSNMFTAL